MDGSRFDAWTRRRLGLGSAGFLASLLGLTQQRAIAKSKKNKKGNGKKKKKKTPASCPSDAQLCREDWADYCTTEYEPAEAQECIAAFAPCCDLYGACKFDAAFTCEDNVPF